MALVKSTIETDVGIHLVARLAMLSVREKGVIPDKSHARSASLVYVIKKKKLRVPLQAPRV